MGEQVRAFCRLNVRLPGTMSVMQGFERIDRELLDAAALAGHLVPAGSMFAFLAAHRAEVFPDADYADLFSPPGVGRPSLPATQMAAVLTLQALHDYSDRETAEAVRFDVRWKVAIGAALDDPGFDASSLVYWRPRTRLLGSQSAGWFHERAVFKTFQELARRLVDGEASARNRDLEDLERGSQSLCPDDVFLVVVRLLYLNRDDAGQRG
jgi:transposase-like protein DUF772